MTKEECYYLGHVSKTFSFKGEIVVHLDTNNPEQYINLESVFVDINDKLIPFFISKILIDRKGSYARLKLEDIDNEESAKRLLKKEIYLPLSQKPDSESTDEDEVLFEDLVGFSVVDLELGSIGKVIEVIDHELNPLIKIEGPRGIALIPFNEHFIVSADKESNTLEVEIPEDLLDLNA
jgi:16S rRNA processing protein RimM